MLEPSRHALPVILIADTDNEFLRLVGGLLKSRYRVRVANSLERAAKVAATEPRPDLVLCAFDATLPGRSEFLGSLPAGSVELITSPIHAATLLALLDERLPTAPVVAVAAAGDPLSRLKGRRLLLADDDELSRQLVTEYLIAAGIGVVAAANGRDALDLLRSERFDWVLTDLHMPELDGFDTCRAIRANPAIADLIVIAATGNDSQGDRQACAAAGMNDFLTKPMTPAQLYSTLARWLDSASTATQAPLAEEQAGARLQIDFGLLDELGRHEAARTEKFLRRFSLSIDEGFAIIAAALAKGDIQAARHQAHRLKSTARWVGALGLGERLEGLEKLPIDQHMSDAVRLLAECGQAYAEYQRQVRVHLAELNTSRWIFLPP